MDCDSELQGSGRKHGTLTCLLLPEKKNSENDGTRHPSHIAWLFQALNYTWRHLVVPRALGSTECFLFFFAFRVCRQSMRMCITYCCCFKSAPVYLFLLCVRAHVCPSPDLLYLFSCSCCRCPCFVIGVGVVVSVLLIVLVVRACCTIPGCQR